MTSAPKPRLLERVAHFFKGPNPLHPGNWEGRLTPMTFRRCEMSDIPQCLEIYKLNEPGRFPEDVIAKYEKSLRDQTSYFLVVEKDGLIVATGGIHRFLRTHVVTLCFGLVRPEQQGKGIGTALLLARLALLGDKEPVYRALIFAVAKSFVFYQRFGFLLAGPWKDPQGREHPIGSLLITGEESRRCRSLLERHGISVPHDEDRIPFLTLDQPRQNEIAGNPETDEESPSQTAG